MQSFRFDPKFSITNLLPPPFLWTMFISFQSAHFTIPAQYLFLAGNFSYDLSAIPIYLEYMFCLLCKTAISPPTNFHIIQWLEGIKLGKKSTRKDAKA